MADARTPICADRFYPGGSADCERMVGDMVRGVDFGEGRGAIVPHAGWVYSGRTAALGLAAVAGSEPETIVVFGAVHVPTHNRASVWARGSWRTPVGEMEVDEELAAGFAKHGDVEVDPRAHRNEHSIEVELPLIRRLMPGVRMVPLMVAPGPWAEDVGRHCAREAAASGKRVVFVGSTDLTHYGPAFGFEPAGSGEDGVRWAKEVNDRRFIELIKRLDGAGVIAEAEEHRNACGAGAIGATIGAMLELGAVEYRELEHITSAERERGMDRLNSVGYEAGVFLSA